MAHFTHFLFCKYVAKQASIIHNIDIKSIKFQIVGDDNCTNNKHFYAIYRDYMSKIGVPINDTKSFKSDTNQTNPLFIEYLKRIHYDNLSFKPVGGNTGKNFVNNPSQYINDLITQSHKFKDSFDFNIVLAYFIEHLDLECNSKISDRDNEISESKLKESRNDML